MWWRIGIAARRGRGGDRGVRANVLVSVLVVVALAAAVATGVLAGVRTESFAAARSVQGVQSRAMAWSGVLGVMSELNAQRAELLRGGEPTLTPEWTVFEEGEKRGVYRVVEVDGVAARSETAKLDVNRASAEMLGAVELIGAELAEAIVAARGGRRFDSVEDLLRVEGVTPGLLYGEAMEGADGLSGSVVGRDGGGGEGEPERLMDVLTVHAFDPNVQSGLGEDGAYHAGRRRINLNQDWSEDLGRAIERRYDRGVADAVRQLMENDTAIGSDADVVRIMRFFNVDVEEWEVPLDTFCYSDEVFRFGRVDVNLAPAAVLAALPGFDEESASRAVLERASLSADERVSPVWLVRRGVLTGERFQFAVPHLAVRSLQWRVRVEAGFVEEGDSVGSAGAIGGFDDAEGVLRDRVVLEAVIDLGSPRPRVAYLRDVTMLGVAGGLAVAMADGEEDDSAVPESLVPEEGAFTGLFDLDEVIAGYAAAEAAEEAARDARLRLPGRGEEAGDARDARGHGGMEDGGSGAGGAAEGEAEADPELALSGPGLSQRDNRLGRWTTKGRRGGGGAGGGGNGLPGGR